MTDQRVDVAALRVLRITPETFDALPEFSEQARPPEKNGTTWKTRLSREPDAPMVICRYVGTGASNGCRIEMLRPEIRVSPPALGRGKSGKGKRIR